MHKLNNNSTAATYPPGDTRGGGIMERGKPKWRKGHEEEEQWEEGK
jgi:hypothetical protein